jgi:hypothetical protein
MRAVRLWLASTRAPWLALLCVALWLPSERARADSYEWDRMQRVLQRAGLSLAELPEGKRIAWVRVVRDEVFVEDEVWPTFLNWFHGTTREDVVRRELLFAEGEPYTEARIEESMRNLRGMAIFALVRIVAVRTDDTRTVGVVVHTRDLWSLRAETGFEASTIVDQFTLRLTERNFAGRNKAVSAEFVLLPRSYKLKQQYYARRVWGSTVQLQETAGIVFNRDRKKAEGSTWNVQVGQPFYNLKQRFSWSSRVTYDTLVVRYLDQRRILQLPDPADDPDGPYAQQVFRQRYLTGYALGYLRLGERFKQTWSLGWDVRAVQNRATAESMLVPALRETFDAFLPRDRTESGPLFQYDILIPQFARFVNLTSYGQTENVRVGPNAQLSVRAPLRAFGSDTNSWVFAAGVGWVLAPAGFLLEASVEGRTRYERSELVDQRFQALLRGATPVLLRSFRVVSRVALDARRSDTARTFVSLGSSNGLRGYTSNKFSRRGANKLLANFEVRSLPIEWQAVHVGAVLFYDTGSVYTALSTLRMHHAVGLGLRVLFPQLNRTPFAFDGGLGADPPFRFVPTLKGRQVVPMTATEDLFEAE